MTIEFGVDFAIAVIIEAASLTVGAKLRRDQLGACTSRTVLHLSGVLASIINKFFFCGEITPLVQPSA